MEIKTFEGEYNKGEFYYYMGKFFAERKYRKLMPYLCNEDEMIWNVIISGEEVIGFVSYKIGKNKTKIGYCYSECEELYKTLLNLVPKSNVQVELEKDFDKAVYENLGFVVYKESKNYWYMELV